MTTCRRSLLRNRAATPILVAVFPLRTSVNFSSSEHLEDVTRSIPRTIVDDDEFDAWGRPARDG